MGTRVTGIGAGGKAKGGGKGLAGEARPRPARRAERPVVRPAPPGFGALAQATDAFGEVASEGANAPRLGWRETIAATVSGLGFELVDVERAQRGLLRVTIDRIPGRHYRLADGSADTGEFVVVDDCEQVTRQLQYALEVVGLDYARLEVSSPGLDRPLRTEADYHRFAGQLVAVTLKQPFEGRKNWQGVLQQAAPPAGEGESPGWRLRFKNGKTEQELGFSLAEVREARLVPVLDFKGRRQGRPSSAEDAAVGADAGCGLEGGPEAAPPAAVAGERDE